MAAPVLDPASFFAALRRTGFLAEQETDTARAECAGLHDPSTIARKLVNSSRLSPWQANQILRGRESYLLGAYTLLDQIAIDAVGEVYAARHTVSGRPVTIRLLGTGRQLNSAGSRRFQDEARRIAALDHINVVGVSSVEQLDSAFLLIMENVSREDLFSLVSPRQGLDPVLAADYVSQAATGLAYAHRCGVVHGNLTPRQMIRVGGTVKITDFALPALASCALLDAAAVVDVGFVAPENVANVLQAEPRSDIYSLGCSLYYLLVGRPPFGGETRADRLRAHCEEDVPSIDDFRPHVPAALIGLCQGMMAKDPARRYASAEQIVNALSQFLADRQSGGGFQTATGSTPLAAPASTPPAARPATPSPVSSGVIARAAVPPPLPSVPRQHVHAASLESGIDNGSPSVVVSTVGKAGGGSEGRPGRPKKSDQTFTVLAAALLALGLLIAAALFYVASLQKQAKDTRSRPAGKGVSLPGTVGETGHSAGADRAIRPSKTPLKNGASSARRPRQGSSPAAGDETDSDFPEPGAFIDSPQADDRDARP